MFRGHREVHARICHAHGLISSIGVARPSRKIGDLARCGGLLVGWVAGLPLLEDF